jgi:hypothetical protein
MKDYWSLKTEALHCDEVASSLSRNCFQYILKCLHVVKKSTMVKDQKDPHYDPLAQVRWLLDQLKENF